MRNLMIGLLLGVLLGVVSSTLVAQRRRRSLSRRRDRGSEALPRRVRERCRAVPARDLRPGREVGDAPASPRLRDLPHRPNDELHDPGRIDGAGDRPAGALGCSDGNVHLPENTAKEAEFIMVEFKDRTAFQK